MGVKNQGMNERRLEHVREIREQFFADEDHHEMTVDDLLAQKDRRIKELTEEVEMLRAVLGKQLKPEPESAPYTQKPAFDFYRD
ncbi:MAG: hypothetical protein HKN94_06660 [Acidimicrobiales bacterium]|nr:hypothetical protein [Acidimicrobiales bacterium]RZV46742.1 MAG: hypothetical protein EX269_06475 [Acidimicrobiales bacterium]